ncbi:response regulator, partial [Salmonella enterica subsp. enterica serovar Enteritidis]|nr:response regulator [Salmonella enterica subsp. enterica serovar Enteritidis]
MKTCLVVDDSKVIRKVARHILETLDFEVREAGDGREALDSCLQTPPDVILLDWNMPVMSGMDFLRALKDSGLPQRPKV